MDISNMNRGMLYMLIASFFFALTGACARYLSPDINPIELVLFRNLIGVIYIAHSIKEKPLLERGGKLYLLIFRGVIGTFSLYSFFYGISKIGLAISITYQQTYPVFMAVAGFLFLGDTLRKKEYFAILVGFSGICLIFLPSVNISLLNIKYHIIGISNAVMTGMAYLSIRSLSEYYDQRSIILSFMISGVILPLISLLAGVYIDAGEFDFIIASFDNPELWHYPVILILGIAALIGQINLTKAFSFKKTGMIAAIGYSNIVFSILFGMMLGDNTPGLLGFTGIFLIICSGLLISKLFVPKEHIEM